tara:strand:+ start:593 stop:898 length:306 start_codon:yes stop_codon:yes gene_type:complete
MVDEVTSNREANPIVPKEDKPLSIVDEAKAVRDEIIKHKEELKEENDRKEKLQSNELLASSAGGRVEPTMVSPEDKKVNDAKEFFKDTSLEKAIDQANAKS